MSRHLEGIRVAIIAADGFERSELVRPMERLIKEGAVVEVVSLRRGSIRGVTHLRPEDKIPVDRTIFTADPDSYDALLIPGGLTSPDLLRQSRRVRDFVKEFDDAGKPIASICHGPWVLISADLVRGRRLTSWPGIRDDVVNAGGEWEDRSVVVDGNWVTSRGPQDLMQFNRAIVEHFGLATHASGRRLPIPLGQIAAGGIALAAIGYGVRRLRREEPVPPRIQIAVEDEVEAVWC